MAIIAVGEFGPRPHGRSYGEARRHGIARLASITARNFSANLAFAFSEHLIACVVKQTVRRLEESKILRREDAVKAWVDGRVHLSQIPSARAESPKENSPGQARRSPRRPG